MALEFFDTHCHLDFPDYDEDRADVVARALDAGVTKMLTIGTCADTSRLAVKIAGEFEGVYAAVGIHPNHCLECKDGDLDEIAALASEKKVVAIGETGLDFYRDTCPADVQRKYFERQMEIAVESDKPVVLHSRDSGVQLIEVVENFVKNHSLRGVFHCFTAPMEILSRALDCGLYIGISGIVTFPKGENVREIARNVPTDRLLLDSDSPFLAPNPYRGKRNEPAHVVKIAEMLSEVTGRPFEEIACATTKNACRLFGLEGE